MPRTNDAIAAARENVEDGAIAVADLERVASMSSAAATAAGAELAAATARLEEAKRACADATDESRDRLHALRRAAEDAEIEASQRKVRAERVSAEMTANLEEARRAQHRAQDDLQNAQDAELASIANALEDTSDDYAAIVRALREIVAPSAQRIERRWQVARDAMQRLARRGKPVARFASTGNAVAELYRHAVLGPLYLRLGNHADTIHDGLFGILSGKWLAGGYQPGDLTGLVVPAIVSHVSKGHTDASAKLLEASLAAGDPLPPKQPPPKPAPAPAVNYEFEDRGGITYARVAQPETKTVRVAARAPKAR